MFFFSVFFAFSKKVWTFFWNRLWTPPKPLRRFSGASPALLRRFSGASPALPALLAASFSRKVKKTWNSMKKTGFFSKRVFFVKSIGFGGIILLCVFFLEIHWMRRNHLVAALAFTFGWNRSCDATLFDSVLAHSTAVRIWWWTWSWIRITRSAVYLRLTYKQICGRPSNSSSSSSSWWDPDSSWVRQHRIKLSGVTATISAKSGNEHTQANNNTFY